MWQIFVLIIIITLFQSIHKTKIENFIVAPDEIYAGNSGFDPCLGDIMTNNPSVKVHLTDSYTYWKEQNQKKFFGVLKDPLHALFLEQVDNTKPGIGIFNPEHIIHAKLLLKTMKQDIPDFYILTQENYQEASLIFVLSHIESSLLNHLVNELGFQPQFIRYDQRLISHVIPFIIFSIVNVGQKLSSTSVLVPSFDAVLTADSKDNIIKFETCLSNEKKDFLSQFFKERAPLSTTTIETFELEHIAKSEVAIKHSPRGPYLEKTFILLDSEIEGIPVQEGDVVHLTKQKHEYENGKYYVIDVNRISAIPFIDSKDLKMEDLPKRFEEFKNKFVYFIPENRIAKIIMEDERIFAKQIKTEEDERFDTDFICYNNNTIQNKGLCEEDGKVWDKTCTHDSECPFFQNAAPYRGGCKNGFCEFPIGVERISFRKFDENTKPACEECPDASDFECCDQQDPPKYIFERLP